MIEMPWMQEIYWREPLWLLLALQPVLLLAIRRLSNNRRLTHYADPDLQAWIRWQGTDRSSSRFFSRNTLYIASWALLAIAMAGPRLLLEQPGVAEKPDMNIMIVVDVSRSMRSRDMQPDRLQRAKIEINELLQDVSNSRIGIILYTSRAHLLLPFTTDLQAVKYYLNLIDSIPLPTFGTEAGDALRLAAKEINTASFDSGSAVLWLTDGDLSTDATDPAPQLHAAVRELNNASIPLYILGLGSPEGDAIPDNEGGWLQYEGRPAISRMNDRLLAELAKSGAGRFIIAQNDDSDWRTLYQQGIAAGTSMNVSANSDETLWQELYPWFLSPAIVLLFISLMPYSIRTGRINTSRVQDSHSKNSGTKRSRKKYNDITDVHLPASSRSLIPVLFGLLMIASLLQSGDSLASRPVAEPSAKSTSEFNRKAYRSYRAEKFEQAADFYRQMTGFHGRFGEGNSYYRLDQYSKAISQFNQAVMLAENDQQRGSAIYNLANTYFKTGDYARAAVLYKDALLYRPSDKASMDNLDISLSLQRLIDERLQQGLAKRMGSGPRSARAEQGLDINNRGGLSFDNEEERKNADIALPAIPPQQLSELLARGLAHVHLVQQKNAAAPLNGNQRSHWNQDIAAARLRMRELADLQPLLWKRLFEMEEGFPAALEEPEIVPGVLPW